MTAVPAPELYCFHHAGGTRRAFARWPRSADVRVIAVDHGRPPGTTILRRARAFVDAHLGRLGPRSVLYGHSMGGLVALQAVQLLEQEHGVQIAGLVIGALAAPEVATSETLTRRVLMGLDTAIGLPGVPGPAASIRERTVADLTACRAHRPSDRQISTPLMIVLGRRDRIVRSHDAQGWRHLAAGSFSEHTLDGEHLFVHTHARQVMDLVLDLVAGCAGRRGVNLV
jgi:surfactin synthase thioesterase subunit